MNPSILVVDDEQAICSAVKRTLRNEKLSVLTANSGSEALEILKNKNVDLIISDQNMPGMKGTELLSIVKQSMPSVGRIILSGQSSKEDLTAAINEASINLFIHKPWNNEQLINKVKENLKFYKAPNITPLINHKSYKNHSTDIYKQISLEQAIKNNRLLLSKKSYRHDRLSRSLSAYRIDWPEISHIKHHGIINMANQAGYLHELFMWYLSETDYALDKKDSIVIDIFFDSFMANDKYKQYLLKLLAKRNNLILKVPINVLRKHEFTDLLPTLYKGNHSLVLNIGNSVIDISDLTSLPISHIEMENSFHSINNSDLTEKRLLMNKDAENIGIKTILSSNNEISIPNYPIAMNFNYYELD